MKSTIQAKTLAEAQDLIKQGYTALDFGTFVKETSVPEGVLDGLLWSPFKTKAGEWMFLTERDGKRKSTLAEGDIARFLDHLVAGNKAITERYVYSASKDGKFLHRVPVSKR
jgi:hypothetical protein